MDVLKSAGFLIVSLWLIWRATKMLRGPTSWGKLYEEADRLCKVKSIVGIDEAKLALVEFIKKNTLRIYKAGLYIFLSYVVMLYGAFFIIKGPNPSPFWQVALFVSFIYIFPSVLLFVTPLFEIKRIDNYIQDRFDGDKDINLPE